MGTRNWAASTQFCAPPAESVTQLLRIAFSLSTWHCLQPAK